MRGRKPSDDPLIFKTVGLNAAQWAWLDLWHCSNNRTSQIRELFERSLKFWPAGPALFGHKTKNICSSGSPSVPAFTSEHSEIQESKKPPVRVIVSPVLTAKNGSIGQNLSDWKSI